jgi:hypothetical protein
MVLRNDGTSVGDINQGVALSPSPAESWRYGVLHGGSTQRRRMKTLVICTAMAAAVAVGILVIYSPKVETRVERVYYITKDVSLPIPCSDVMLLHSECR